MPTDTAPRAIGSRLELFVDHYLIDSLTNCRLQLQRPRLAGEALKFNAPWEGSFAGCITVIKDGGLYRMYYRGLPEATEEPGVENTCCAHSVDGIHWTKVELDLFNYRGHAKNNIVMYNVPHASHNFCPFLDTRPGVPADERFKAVAGVYESGIFFYASADGLRWRRLTDKPVVTAESYAFDSQNVAFWSEHEGCYLYYFRTFKGEKKGSNLGYRWVSRARSDDLVHWSAWEQMDAGETPVEELYTQQTHPYYRAPHIYISLAARFMEGKQVLTDAQAVAAGVAPRYYNDCSDTVLITSRGGNRFDRTFMESFVRPGPGLQHWVSRTNYCGVGVVPTGPGEMSLYAHRQYAQTTNHADRFTLRTDGFASVAAPYAGGELLTRPLTFAGRELVLNYATSAAGGIKVEIQDAGGRAIPGFALADAKEIVGDEIERVAAWAGGTDVGMLAGRPVRLRFVMKDADLYSLRFR